MTQKKLIQLVQKDLKDFADQFGKETLDQYIKAGHLPIRQSTSKLLKDGKLVINKNYTQYLAD